MARRSKVLPTIFLLLVFSPAFFVGVLHAEEESTVDIAHRQLSQGLLSTSRWLDSFFADPRMESEATKTRVKVRFSLFAEEESDVEFDVRAGVRLDLPVLKDRLQLLIAGDPDADDDFRAVTGGEGTSPSLAGDEEHFSLSLRYLVKRRDKSHFSLRSGLRWRNGMPAILLEPRYRLAVPVNGWQFRFTQRLTTLSDGTVKARSLFDFDRQLSNELFLRASAEGVWDKDEHGYAYSLGASLYQPLSRRRALIYGWSNGFVTHPHHRLEAVTLSVRYRQRIWRDWLFYEVVPQLDFPREEGYEITPGILLRLEMILGYYPKLALEPQP